jgi:hypothetical protein
MEFAHLRVDRAARAAFGTDVSVFGPASITSDQMADIAMANFGAADLQIDGQYATITMHCGAELLAFLPVLRAWEGAPIYFARDADGWKFDPGKTLLSILIDKDGRVQRVPPAVMQAYYEAVTMAAEEVFVAIQSGQLANLRAAEAMLQTQTQRYSLEKRVQLPPGDFVTLPVGVIELQGQK